MSAPYDIFQMEAEGGLRWVEAVRTIEDAKQRIKELAGHAPGGYIILDQKSGSRININVDGESA